MPLDQLIIDLPDFKIINYEGGQYLRITAIYVGSVKCISCGSDQLRTKDSFFRRVKHICLGDRPSELHLKAHKFYCLSCGKYFNQRFPGVLPRRRSSEPFRRDVFQRHHDGITQKTLAKRLRLGTATVERWYQDFTRLEDAKINRTHCPKVLGIDEHFFTRKRGYATTFANLSKHRVYDVTLGRSEQALKPYLQRLSGKENVRVILMDLSETYRSIAHKYFPNAKVVADRFHVIRLVNQRFLETWKQLDPEGRKHRGLLSLMRRHHKNLKMEQKINLRKYLAEVPGLESIYDFKQGLTKLLLLKRKNKRQCRELIPGLLKKIEQLQTCGFEPLMSLGKTLDSWKEEIVRMWRFTKTNSITEGLHNKMEMLSRRAFGFRNFENYRLRVRVHCG